MLYKVVRHFQDGSRCTVKSGLSLEEAGIRGVQIDIMDLGKLSAEAKRAHLAGENVSEAIKALVAKLRKN